MATYRVTGTRTVEVVRWVKAPTKLAVEYWTENNYDDWEDVEPDSTSDWEFKIVTDADGEAGSRVNRDGEEIDE